MAKKRKTPDMILKIQELRRQGVPLRKISRSLGIHRETVRKHLDPSDPSYLPSEPKEACDPSWEDQVGWDKVLEEVRRGVPVKTLWQESGVDVGYSGFWKACAKRSSPLPETALKLSHVPGERAFFDYCDGVAVLDPDTGKARASHLFVGVLPFSGWAFAEFVFDQKLPSFLRSQSRFFAAIGGVTPYVVIDNLKSGVTRAHRFDPDLNKTYCDFAAHYGFAVLPARPYEPRDKAAVEALIGVIQRGFFPTLRHLPCQPLGEINRSLHTWIADLNDTLMKDHGVSRNQRFELEKEKLLPLPASPFEISEWRKAAVHPDCHIQVAKNFYSVPFTFAGKTVRVRLTPRLVEVFDDEGNPVTAHERLHAEHRYATDLRHYPEAKASYACFDVHQAKLQAARIGPHTEALVQKLLSGTHPLKYLRRAQGILRLAQRKRVQAASLEYASQVALSAHNLRLDFIQAAAKHHDRFGPRPVACVAQAPPRREADSLFLHQNPDQPLTQERKTL